MTGDVSGSQSITIGIANTKPKMKTKTGGAADGAPRSCENHSCLSAAAGQRAADKHRVGAVVVEEDGVRVGDGAPEHPETAVGVHPLDALGAQQLLAPKPQCCKGPVSVG